MRKDLNYNWIDEEWKQLVRPRLSSFDSGFPSTSAEALYSEEVSGRRDDAWEEYTPYPSIPSSLETGIRGHGWDALHFNSALSGPADAKALWKELDHVYVILFGVGERETEGIYSLRATSNDDGLPQDTIIAFEKEEDAARYAGLLEATMEHLPHVCPIEPRELLEFCLDSGYSCRLEADGSHLIPPNYNVGVTDWESSLRLREGHYSVLEQDPVLSPSTAGQSEWAGHAWPHQLNNAGFYPGSDHIHNLEEVRASLERLIPKD